MGTGVRLRWVACCAALFSTIGAAQAPGGEPEALLGGPAPAGDLYGTRDDAALNRRQALTQAERAARGALPGTRDGRKIEQPIQPAEPRHVPRPALKRLDDEPATRDAKVNRADPGTQSPTQSALSIYHGPGDVGKAAGQVYRMPW